MSNPRLAARYAKSIVDLSTEQKQLDAVYTDMKFFKAVFKSNPDFVALFESPIIKADKKEKIVAAVVADRVGKLTIAFVNLLINKGRESYLPEIADAFIDQYNELKGIRKVKLTTATAVSEAIQSSIIDKVKKAPGINSVELETAVKEELIGGFILETGGQLIDASILRDLNDVKRQFLENDYVSKIK
jgi:F-type H+-transporting ATPase subunit delta